MVNTKKRKHGPPPCGVCGGSCCRYVATEIDKPTCKRDYDMIRWYLLHEHVNVYVDHHDDWFVEFETKCGSLDRENHCSTYETRPQICREHGEPPDFCEYFDQPHKLHFSNATAFEDHLDRKGVNWRWKKRRK